ncbi:MAG: serine--tRNA ligase [Candidatus Lokiarchaeota archaeon]|nr:serine--tRNA ligase [Candidatus Lokiarchaeota archaeon]
MLDIELFRTNLQQIIESEKKRFKDPAIAQMVYDLDVEYRTITTELQQLSYEKNKINENIGNLMKQGKKQEADKLKKEASDLSGKITLLSTKEKTVLEKREEDRYRVGNLLHESVPLGEGEESNEIIRTVGKLPTFNFSPLSHVDLITLIDGADTKKASELVGSRFYYLKGDIVSLNLALIQYALSKMINKGFTPLWTPFFIKYDIIKAAAELADFEEQLYKIQDEDLFMIATSEQSLASFHYDEIIEPEQLPIKYVGVSSCFRREAGSHGKDTLGIFRVHQFEKVEQFVFCSPEDSWNIFEELIQNAEELYKELKIPYRIVNIASGELNDNAAKKYDLEAWFPGSKTYRELVSCSNCTDYQARKLKVRMGIVGSNQKKQVVHTLNSTAVATERTICCILENYQNKDHSVKIPEVLQKYMNGKKVINAINQE